MYKSFVERLIIEKVSTDVSLVCEGGMCEAHKIILSACSPVFESLLANQVSPIIILNGIPLDHIQKMLDFVYKGNMMVSISELPALLETVECFQFNAMAEAIRSLQKENPEQKVNEEDTK